MLAGLGGTLDKWGTKERIWKEETALRSPRGYRAKLWGRVILTRWSAPGVLRTASDSGVNCGSGDGNRIIARVALSMRIEAKQYGRERPCNDSTRDCPEAGGRAAERRYLGDPPSREWVDGMREIPRGALIPLVIPGYWPFSLIR